MRGSTPIRSSCFRPDLVPSLATRKTELSRIVDEHMRDAIADLGANEEHVTAADRAWVLEDAPRPLGEIEKATRRIMALRTAKNLPRPADKLGMAPVSLESSLGFDPAIRRR